MGKVERTGSQVEKGPENKNNFAERFAAVHIYAAADTYKKQEIDTSVNLLFCLFYISQQAQELPFRLRLLFWDLS